MNVFDMFNEMTAQIMDDPHLTSGEFEEKIIQALDLCHFIDVYNRPLKIIDSSHTIKVVEEDGIRKGIYFCDLVYNTSYSFDVLLYRESYLKDVRDRLHIKELWFVAIVESFLNDDLTGTCEFVEMNKINSLYNKIIYFNFSRSTLKFLNKLYE